MITAAVTAAIGAVLAYFGVPPGPYLAGVAIAVKLTIVGLVALFGLRALAKRKAEQGPAVLTVPAEGGATPAKPGGAA